MQARTYFFFGLHIKSQIPLPGVVVTGVKRHDLFIREGAAKKDIGTDDVSAQGWLSEDHIYYHSGRSGTLLSIQNVGYIWIGAKGEIVLERLPGVSLDEGRFYIFGSGLGIYLLQRGYFPMHGSTVASAGRGLMFSGPSGVGKSTLSAYWIDKGYALVADDVSLIHFQDDGMPYVQQALPHIKLWEDSAQALQRDPGALPHLLKGWEKRRLPVEASAMSGESVLKAILELSPENCEYPRIELLSGAERFSMVAGNIYRGEAISWLGQLANHFAFSSRLAAAVPVYRLTRPTKSFALEAIYELIENTLITTSNHESDPPR